MAFVNSHEKIRFLFDSTQKRFSWYSGGSRPVAFPRISGAIFFFFLRVLVFLFLSIALPIIICQDFIGALQREKTWTIIGICVWELFILLCICFLLPQTISAVFHSSEKAVLATPLTNVPKSGTFGIRPVWSKEKKQALIILNPFCGIGKGLYIAEKAVFPAFEKAGVKYELCITDKPFHATEIVRDHPRLFDFQMICVCGGDGTYNEVVNGLLLRPDAASVENFPPIGVIPCGSSNSTVSEFIFQDYVKDLPAGGAFKEHSLWSKGVESVVEIALWCMQRYLDSSLGGISVPVSIILGSTAGATVAGVNAAFLGLLGDVNIVAEEFRWFGPLRYDLAAVCCCLRGDTKETEPTKIIITDANGDEHVVAEGSVMNCTFDIVQHWTDAMRVAAASQINSGVGTMFCNNKNDMSRDELFSIFMGINQAAHLTPKLNPDCKFQLLEWKSATIYFKNPSIWALDGELFYHDGKLKLDIIKGPIHLCVSHADINHAAPAPEAAYGRHKESMLLPKPSSKGKLMIESIHTADIEGAIEETEEGGSSPGVDTPLLKKVDMFEETKIVE